ncbi:Hypothetical predicted protein [Octopus vulgaris]|uniref:Uncharacterized protein n=1 Tax=Octopus vulgaris TaxID=6645 RepID=A0AA36BNX8_OCTVU|nr:Hypothetical predicted protein [Octopus vulgaris]
MTFRSRDTISSVELLEKNGLQNSVNNNWNYSPVESPNTMCSKVFHSSFSKFLMEMEPDIRNMEPDISYMR